MTETTRGRAPPPCPSIFNLGFLHLLFLRAVVKRVVPTVYRQQRAEGTFRYDHAWLRTHSESVVFCGVEAVEGRERDRLGESFDVVVAARWEAGTKEERMRARARPGRFLPRVLCCRFRRLGSAGDCTPVHPLNSERYWRHGKVVCGQVTLLAAPSP